MIAAHRHRSAILAEQLGVAVGLRRQIGAAKEFESVISRHSIFPKELDARYPVELCADQLEPLSLKALVG